jgi:hypothetical protein
MATFIQQNMKAVTKPKTYKEYTNEGVTQLVNERVKHHTVPRIKEAMALGVKEIIINEDSDWSRNKHPVFSKAYNDALRQYTDDNFMQNSKQHWYWATHGKNENGTSTKYVKMSWK